MVLHVPAFAVIKTIMYACTGYVDILSGPLKDSLADTLAHELWKTGSISSYGMLLEEQLLNKEKPHPETVMI